MIYKVFLTVSMVFFTWFLCKGQEPEANQKALKSQLQTIEDSKKADIFLALADEYIYMDSLAISLDYFNKAALYAEKYSQWDQLSSAYYQIGELYNRTENYTEAIQFYFKCYKICEKQHFDNLLVYSSAGLGNVYIQLHDWTRALKYINKAMDIAEKNKMKHDIPKLLNLIGVVYLRNNQMDSAFYFFNQLLEAGKALNDSILIGCAYNNMADANIKQGKYQLAIDLLDQSYRIQPVQKDERALASIFSNKGESLLHLEKNEEALQYLYLSNQLAKKNGFLSTEMTNHKNLSDLHSKMGNLNLAFEHYKLYTSLKDSIFNIEKQKQIQNLNLLNIQEHFDQQIEVLKHKASTRAIILYFILFIILLLTILFIQTYRRFKLKIKLQEIEKSKMEGTIDQQNRELVSLALNLGQKSKLISKVEESVKNINQNTEKNKIEGIINEISGNIRDDKYLDHNWDMFIKHFNGVHPSFFNAMQAKHPDLSSNDLKHCAFMKLSMGIKEVALINNITPKSVYMIRYRLKIKLNLKPEDDLQKYINSFS